MCLVRRQKELILVKLSLRELIWFKSEFDKIDLCLDTLKEN
jgi:hypothetical protein